jgi:energy-coupling factor transporter ATP-binding protein EcfA2
VAYIFQVPDKQFILNRVEDEMAHGLKRLGISQDEIDERVEYVLANVHLEQRREASPYLLSHGQKRRLSVACMVIAEPEVVILDEPTFGQDWRQAQRLMQYMRELADGGAAVTFITHDMRLVAEYADRCVAMCEGRVIFDGTPEEMFSTQEILQRTQLKAPPVFHFSEEMCGVHMLRTSQVIDALGVSSGRSGTVVQGS